MGVQFRNNKVVFTPNDKVAFCGICDLECLNDCIEVTFRDIVNESTIGDCLLVDCEDTFNDVTFVLDTCEVFGDTISYEIESDNPVAPAAGAWRVTFSCSSGGAMTVGASQHNAFGSSKLCYIESIETTDLPVTFEDNETSAGEDCGLDGEADVSRVNCP